MDKFSYTLFVLYFIKLILSPSPSKKKEKLNKVYKEPFLFKDGQMNKHEHLKKSSKDPFFFRFRLPCGKTQKRLSSDKKLYFYFIEPWFHQTYRALSMSPWSKFAEFFCVFNPEKKLYYNSIKDSFVILIQLSSLISESQLDKRHL